MSDSRNQPGCGRPFEDLSVEQSRALFGLGSREPHPMVDFVQSRLTRPDGSTWLAATAGIAGSWDPAQIDDNPLITGDLALEDVKRMKNQGKELHHSSSDPDTHARAFLTYFLALAAARLHCAVELTRRDPEDVTVILLDLAEVLPEPWSSLASRGAMADAGESR